MAEKNPYKVSFYDEGEHVTVNVPQFGNQMFLGSFSIAIGVICLFATFVLTVTSIFGASSWLAVAIVPSIGVFLIIVGWLMLNLVTKKAKKLYYENKNTPQL